MPFLRSVTCTALILLSAGAASAQSRSKKADDPDVKEISSYRLNMDVIQRYVRAVRAGMNDPATKKCFEDNLAGNAPTLDAGEKIIDSCPSGVAQLKAAGLKPREFLIVTAALIGDFMAVGLKKKGAIKEYPPSVSPENAAFVEQNYEKLQAMLAPLTGDDK
jgi:hypothetical protein